MIRFIFVVLFVVLFLILSTPLMLVEWIIGKFNPGLKDKSSLAIVNWAFPRRKQSAADAECRNPGSGTPSA